MAVAIRAAGDFAGNATVTTQAITAPACSAGDILIAALINKSVTVNKISPPDNTWNEFIPQNVTDCTLAADDHEYALFWKRATGSGGNFTFTKATDDNVLFGGVIVAYQGAVSHGNPLDPATPTAKANAAAADNVSFNAFDPIGTDTHVVYVAFYGNDATTFNAAMVGNTNPVCATDCDVETNTGTDCSIAFASGNSDGSAIAARTWASASSTDAGSTGVVFALSPSTALGDYWPLASADDGTERYDSPYANAINSTLTTLTLVTGAATHRSYGVRFQSVVITPHATVTSATLKVYVPQDKYDDFDLRVYAEDVDAGTVFNTTNANIAGRTRTTAYVDWDAASAGTGWKTSPDLTTVVQEIVDRTSWASGNAINLLIDAQGTSSAAFTNWDGQQGMAPELTVSYVLQGTCAMRGRGQTDRVVGYTTDFATLPAGANYVLTDPTVPPTWSSTSGHLRASSPSYTEGRAFWMPDATPVTLDGEVYSVWYAQDPNMAAEGSQQQGHVHRAQNMGGGLGRALTVTKNIYLADFTIINFHEMDGTSGATGFYWQIGTFTLPKLKDTELPWYVKTRVLGNRLEAKVWLEGESEPSWDDPTAAGGCTIPATDTDYLVPGGHGIYAAHIPTGGTADYDDLIITLPRFAVGSFLRTGTAALAGTGTATATGTIPAPEAVTGEAALTATGSSTVTPRVTRISAGALAGTGSAQATGRFLWSASATLAGTSALTATPTITPAVKGTAALTGTGSAQATGIFLWSATATLAGTSTLTATGIFLLETTSALSGTGTLTATGVRTLFDQLTLVGVGTLVASGVVFGAGDGFAGLTGTGTLTGSGVRTVFIAPTFAGTGTLTANGLGLLIDTAALTGSSSMVATTSVIMVGRVTILGVGTLTVTATFVAISAGATLVGVGLAVTIGRRVPPYEPHEGVAIVHTVRPLATITLGETTPEWD